MILSYVLLSETERALSSGTHWSHHKAQQGMGLSENRSAGDRWGLRLSQGPAWGWLMNDKDGWQRPVQKGVLASSLTWTLSSLGSWTPCQLLPEVSVAADLPGPGRGRLWTARKMRGGGWLGSSAAAFCSGLHLFGTFTWGKQQVTSGPRIPSHLRAWEWTDTASPPRAPQWGRAHGGMPGHPQISHEPVFRRLGRGYEQGTETESGKWATATIKGSYAPTSLAFTSLSSQGSLCLLLETGEARWFWYI